MSSERVARNLTVLGFLGGTAAIAAAWGYQLIGGYLPCKLCLEQRVPYYVGLPLAALAIILMTQRRVGLATIVLLAVAAIFAYGSGLGIYQSGAEWGFWAGPNDCGGGGAAPASAANMLQALQSTRIVSCTEASWRMFGLSFAGWNAVASGGVALLALISAFVLNRRENEATLNA
ncbi:disulfide bond formation protein B [Roseibium sp. SCPC15]|uniref:disulfide bond formation protein B n=1 Tax=Roseibium sp. SCP15 TaxID=3141376 RepID=UPI0033367E46